MKAVLIALLAVTSALAFTEQEYQDSFVSWMKKFEKTYEAAEFFHRYGIFKATMDRVEAHNALNLSWTSGLNQFSDLTNEEFGRILPVATSRWALMALRIPGFPLSLAPTPTPTAKLTGLLLALSPPSRTKANAVHAGLSPPPALLKVGSRLSRALP
jgi:hypothetical protein